MRFLHLSTCLILAAMSKTGLHADDLPIHSVTINGYHVVPASQGDTWMPVWTRNNDLFSPSNDSHGFYEADNGNNLNFNLVTGDNPEHLDGKTLNVMADYGFSVNGPDGASWKSSGCMALDGALYWFIGRHKYGESSGDKTKRQTASNGSIIKSSDGGLTWMRTARENYDHPMFPGSRFASGYFINYGQDGHQAVVDGSDKYVYTLSNNGFWDNGDDVVLGRVLRSKIGDLSGADWQYFTHGDGVADAAWSGKPADAAPVITNANHLGMTGATWLPTQKCYLMIGWYYPAGGGKLPDACHKSIWDFYVALHPWGPWRLVGSHTWEPEGFYCPEICPKFTSPDGSTIWVCAAGNWDAKDFKFYRLNMVSLSLK